MAEALLLVVMEQAVGLDTFWPTVASHASPATQLALAGTSRAARDAAVQCAPKATLTVQLLPPPTPATLAVLRNSGRTLPANIIINNNSTDQHRLLTANRIAHRFIMPHLSCAAVTSLQLGGGTWMVDTALLTSINAALPGLSKLVLSNVTTPQPAVAIAPALAWPSLRTVSVGVDANTAVQPAAFMHMLAVLGVRTGGGVINLTVSDARARPVLWPMLRGNQLHALRKLSMPRTTVRGWGAGQAGGALIRNLPALEHLKVHSLEWDDDEHGTSAMCVPWRIVQVQQVNVAFLKGLPLGSQPGQPPLILRVMVILRGDTIDDGASAEHLVSTAPGKRRVQLECTQKAYRTIGRHGDTVKPVLRVMTLTTTGLSNLILDGIDSADDIKDLVDLSTTGLTITMDGTDLDGLHDLPQVTRLELRADNPGVWDEYLLASLPAHVTEVQMSGGLTLELVSRMCVEVSRLPHRQAHPLRLCVPGVVGWLDAVAGALTAAGIRPPGVVGVPHE